MTSAQWLFADKDRRLIEPTYQLGRDNYLSTAKDPNGPIKTYNAIGDTAAESWASLLDQLGLEE